MPIPVLILLASLAQPDTDACAGGAAVAERAALLAAFNTARSQAQLAPLTASPTLCWLAADRAADMAAEGELSLQGTSFNTIGRRLLGAGYEAHSWTASTSLGIRAASDVINAWQQERRASFDKAVLGDFTEVGIGAATLGGLPLYVFVFALPKQVIFARQTAGLADLAAVRTTMLAQVNALRAEAGRTPLAAHPTLDAAAQRHAEDMLVRGYFDHLDPAGSHPMQRVQRAGFAPRRVAENIAKGLFTPTEVVERWMNSRGHRRNLLSPDYDLIGIGLAFGTGPEGSNEVLWVQVFAR